MKKKKSKHTKDINELTKGFEKLIEKEGYREDGKELFEKVVKKAVKGKKK